jgi:CRP/FNR family transcriptional regulator
LCQLWSPIYRRFIDDLPKGQLAALLGTVPETLSRAFYKLSQEGKIEIDGTKIKLLNKTLEKC